MRKSFVSSVLVPFTIFYSVMANSYGVHEDHPYDFVISKDIYKFSEIYQIKSPLKETYPGSIKKSAFRIRTNYDLSNKDGWQATGITRVISLGSVYPWATDVDVYDTRGVKIGLIDGDMATLEAAKFNIYEYDEEGKSVAIGSAYASPDFNRFVILSTSDNPHPIAELNRNVNEKTWSTTVHYPEKIDDRMVRIFAGFVIDFENKFLASPDEIAQRSDAE